MLIWFDGFDAYETNQFLFPYAAQGGMGIGTNAGRFGQGGLTCNGGYNTALQIQFNTNYTDVWTGFAVSAVSEGGYGWNGSGSYGNIVPLAGTLANGDDTIITFASNGGYFDGFHGTCEAFITYNALLGTWRAVRVQQVTNLVPLLITGAIGQYNMGQAQWHWIDIHYVPSLGSGTVQVYVDGNEVINVSGVQTSSWLNEINSVYIGAPNIYGPTVTNSLGGTYDDWYILDASTGPHNVTGLGDSRIYSLVPNRDAGPNNGVPSTGFNHYAMVDEPQNDGLTTYVQIQGISGQEELYGTGTLPTTPSIVHATRVLNIVEQTAGGVIAANAVVVSHSVEAQGPSQPLLSVFFSQYGIFETDPATGVPWTYSNVNIADVGFVIA